MKEAGDLRIARSGHTNAIAMASRARPPRFRELEPGLSQEVVDNLESHGYVEAAPVQATAIPLLLRHKDVLAEAVTGSGKTLAFAVPTAELLERPSPPLGRLEVGAVVVAPTRELGRQTYGVVASLLRNGRQTQLLLGGSEMADDLAQVKAEGANCLVGTPGRLNDVLRRGTGMEFKRLELLVLDEADRLLDMGFKQALEDLMAFLPRQRRTGLFSATQAEGVERLSAIGLRNPVRVSVRGKKSSQAKTPDTLAVYYEVCEQERKLARLAGMLQSELQYSKCIVYFLTCACVDFFAPLLSRLVPSVAFHQLHGRMKQKRRNSELEAFSSNSFGCLLCTDVAARGIDLPDVDWTIQFDPPQDPDHFVHRAGRTARMGKPGNAFVFLQPHEEAYVEFLRRRSVPVESDESPLAACAAEEGALDVPRRMAETSREAMERGAKAFVTYVRAYKEHRCPFIFRFHCLDLGRLGNAFGLLRLPSMPELAKARRGSLSGFQPSPVDPSEVPYSDPAKERARRQEGATSSSAKRGRAQPFHSINSASKQKRSDSDSTGVKKKDANNARAGKQQRKRKKVRRQQERMFRKKRRRNENAFLAPMFVCASTRKESMIEV